MEYPTRPVLSGLLFLTSAPLCYSVSLPTGQPQRATTQQVLLPRPRRVLRGIVFTRSVCLCVCVCVCVSGQYFSILFLCY